MKRLFIIDTYPSDEKDVDILNKCISSIQPLGYDIMIVSHLPIDQETSKRVNYTIFDSNNTFLPAHYTPFYWMCIEEFIFQINNAGHTLPICRNMNTSINMAKCLNYDEFIFMESDIIFSLEDLNKLRVLLDDAFVEQGKKMLFFRPEDYRDCENSYVYETLLFAGKPDFFLDTFVPPLDLEQWLSIPMGYTLELSFYERFSHREPEFYLIKDHSSNIFSKSKVNLSRYGLFNCEVLYNEIVTEDSILFVMNSLIEDSPKDVKVYVDGKLEIEITLYNEHYLYNTYKYDDSEIVVTIHDKDDSNRLFMTKTFRLSKENSEKFKERGTIKYQ